VYDGLGTRLPADYVALISHVGAGLLGCREWLGLADPFQSGRPDGLLACATDAGDAYRCLRDGPPEFHGLGFPDDYPRAAWPEPGGFLACASTRDGDYLGWLTVGGPEQWPVMVWPQQADGDTLIDLPLTEVLLRWLHGDLDLPGLPRCLVNHEHRQFASW
jgi:hypothetical protein